MVHLHRILRMFNSGVNKSTYTSSAQSSPIQSFASDRDPKVAEEMPVYRHVGKSQKKVNIIHACGLNATGKKGISQCVI